jgi:hypothetical protein
MIRSDTDDESNPRAGSHCFNADTTLPACDPVTVIDGFRLKPGAQFAVADQYRAVTVRLVGKGQRHQSETS